MDRPWVNRLRQQFPVTQKGAFFDISYENCGSLYMMEALAQYLRDKADIAPHMAKNGGGGKGKTIDVIAGTRARLARFLGAAGPENIAFTANTCQAISYAVMGLDYAPGDNIVVGAMEHVSVLMPCLNMRRFGVECRLVGAGSDLWVTADDLLAACNEHTKAVCVSYVQSCSGYRIDLEYLAEKCHERNIRVIVDAIQALGLVNVNFTALGIDALAGSGYKGMLATEGMGFLCLSPELTHSIKPLFACYNAGMTIDREKGEVVVTDEDDARKLEAGTIPFMSIYVMNEALKRIEKLGMDNISFHVSECFEKMYNGLTAAGYEIATPFESEHRCGSLLIKTGDAKALADFLEERDIFVSEGKPGYVRVSAAPFTNEDDISRLVKAAEEYKNR